MTLVAKYTEEDWQRLGRAYEDARGRRSQNQVAEALDMSPTTLGDIEKGRRQPRYSTLRVLEEFYGWEKGTFELILKGQLNEPDAGPPQAEIEALQATLSEVLDRQSRVGGKSGAAPRGVSSLVRPRAIALSSMASMRASLRMIRVIS
jgi:transcriptional regulator with XRE-family HTH domain